MTASTTSGDVARIMYLRVSSYLRFCVVEVSSRPCSRARRRRRVGVVLSSLNAACSRPGAVEAKERKSRAASHMKIIMDQGTPGIQCVKRIGCVPSTCVEINQCVGC